MRSHLRWAFVGLLVLVAVGALFANQTPPPPTPLVVEQASNKPVTVVIDYGDQSKRSIDVFDLPQVPAGATGWDVLKQARVQIQGTDQFPTGFACRLNWWPTVEMQDCRDTPKASEGHWAYFVTNSQIGKGWIMSGQGAATHIPDCGGYEGWSWMPAGSAATPPRFEVTQRGCK